MRLWQIVFSNYDPAEVDSMWDKEEDARKRLTELSDEWRIEVVEIGPPSVTEILKAAVEHGETAAGATHGVGCSCMDTPAREVRALLMEALTPARKEPIPPEQLEEDGRYEPNPLDWRYAAGERDRYTEQRARLRVIMSMALNGI